MPPTRILLADDHQLFLDGLRSLLDRMDGYAVVGEARTGQEVLTQITQIPVDCVLLDIQMPGLNGIEITRLLKKQMPAVRVLAVSMAGDYDTVRAMLRAGADGYLLKNTGKAELTTALETIGRGQIYLSPELTRVVLHGVANRPPPAPTPVAETLTRREREVLTLVGQGLTNEQIGQQLFLSPLTIKTHRANLMAKLGINSMAGLIHYALQLTQPKDPPANFSKL